MINYISRDKLIEDCDYQIKKPSNKEVHVTMDEAFAHFKELVLLHPTADVEEVKHGTWIQTSMPSIYCCNKCGAKIECFSYPPNGRYPYCHCGAIMDGKENEE